MPSGATDIVSVDLVQSERIASGLMQTRSDRALIRFMQASKQMLQCHHLACAGFAAPDDRACRVHLNHRTGRTSGDVERGAAQVVKCT